MSAFADSGPSARSWRCSTDAGSGPCEQRVSAVHQSVRRVSADIYLSG